MWKTLLRACGLLLGLTIITGILYPLAVTGLAQLCFPRQANGDLVRRQGQVIGSTLIGQDFAAQQYFHGRPSAARYDGGASGGSNLGPTNRQLIATVRQRIEAVRTVDRLAEHAVVPSDLVTASASGLDPHITPQGALLQATRVAKARQLAVTTVRQLIRKHTEVPFLGLFGQPRVNVLRINLALDALR